MSTRVPKVPRALGERSGSMQNVIKTPVPTQPGKSAENCTAIQNIQGADPKRIVRNISSVKQYDRHNRAKGHHARAEATVEAEAAALKEWDRGIYASNPAQSTVDVAPTVAKDCTIPVPTSEVSFRADPRVPKMVSPTTAPKMAVPPRMAAPSTAAPATVPSETVPFAAIHPKTRPVQAATPRGAPSNATPTDVVQSNGWNFMREWQNASLPGSVHPCPTPPNEVATSSNSAAVNCGSGTTALVEQPGARAEVLKESIKQLAETIRTQKRRRHRANKNVKSANPACGVPSQALENALDVKKAHIKQSTAVQVHVDAGHIDGTTERVATAPMSQSAIACTVPSPPKPAAHATVKPRATPASQQSVRTHYQAPNGETFTADELIKLSTGAQNMEKKVTIFFRPSFISNPWEGMKAVQTTCLTSY